MVVFDDRCVLRLSTHTRPVINVKVIRCVVDIVRLSRRQFNQNSRSYLMETIKLSSGKVLRFAKKEDPIYRVTPRVIFPSSKLVAQISAAKRRRADQRDKKQRHGKLGNPVL